MTIQQAVGLMLIASPFLGFGLYAWRQLGAAATAFIFGITAVTTAAIIGGVFLLTGSL